MRVTVSRSELARFLVKAKTETFASGHDARRLPDGGRRYSFRDGEWTYHDRYYGTRFDSGLEVVVLHKVPIWAMVYRGGMLPKFDHDAREAFAFLKSALRDPDPDLPVRGPARFAAGAWQYVFRARGSILEFSGTETVLRDGRRVYRRVVTGGALRHRRYEIGFIT